MGRVIAQTHNPVAQGGGIYSGGTSVPTVVSVLSNPTGYSVDTTGSNGILYSVVTTSATAPTAQQVIDGEDHLGTAAITTSTKTITASGFNLSLVFGLSTSTNYYRHFCHVEADTTRSAVSTSAVFTHDGEFTDGVWGTDFDAAAGYPVECSGDACDTNNLDSINWIAVSGTVGGPDGDATKEDSEALAAANNSGDYGHRMWIGSSASNQQSFGNRLSFTNLQKEIWIKYKMRYELGFDYGATGPAYDKWLYIYAAAGSWIIPEPAQGRFWFATSTNGQLADNIADSIDWTDFFGRTSDGLFHDIEMYIRMDTDQTDGALRMFIDDILVCDANNIDISGGNADSQAGIDRMTLKNNQAQPDHSGIKYFDQDNFRIFNKTPPNIHGPSGYPIIGDV